MELNLHTVEQTLSETLLRNATGKLAENTLKAWATKPGYYFLLQSVYLDTAITGEVRWLAVIQFKHGVEKYWRRIQPNSIRLEEQLQIRARVFCLLDEKNPSFTIQNAHAVARMARFDFPAHWPTLFSELESILKESFAQANPTKCHNVLVVLNQVIKSLALIKLGKGKTAMQAEIGRITPVLISIYSSLFKQCVAEPQESESFSACYLSLKILRRIMADGYPAPHLEQLVEQFFATAAGDFRETLSEYSKTGFGPLEKFLTCFCKLFANFNRLHLTSFLLMSSFDDITSTLFLVIKEKAEVIYGCMDSAEDNFWANFAIRILHILRLLVVKQSKQQGVLHIQRNVTKEETQQANKKLAQYFSDRFVFALTDLIVDWYLKLRPVELENWNNEPEEFFHEGLDEMWEYLLRPCAENFFRTLMTSNKEILAPYVMNKIEQSGSSNNEMEQILVKDSIFTVIELSEGYLDLDFNQFLVNAVLPSLANSRQQVELKILKRRTCLIVSKWALHSSTENFVKIYELLVQFLHEDLDKTLVLSAIQTLQVVMVAAEQQYFDQQELKSGNWCPQSFAGFSSSIIARLLASLQSMSLLESRIYILKALNTLLEATHLGISKGDLTNLLNSFPAIWGYFEDKEENLLIKNILIRILKSLIVCFKDSSVTSGISLKIIDSCCSYSSEYYNVLSEDGFELWQAYLHYYPVEASGAELLSRFALLYEPMFNTTEILPLILSIIRSYVILAPIETILQGDFKLNLTKILTNLSDNLILLRDDSFEIYVSIVDLLFVKVYQYYSFESFDNSNEFVVLFYQLISESGVFKSVLDAIADENVLQHTVKDLILLAARTIFGSLTVFSTLIKLTYQAASLPMFKQVVDSWLASSKSLFDARKLKQNVLGLSNLLTINNELNQTVFTEENLGRIFSLWLSFLAEVNESDQGDSPAYYKNFNYYEFDLIYADSQEAGMVSQHTPEFIRYQTILAKYDPIHTLNSTRYLQQVMTFLQHSLDRQGYRQVIALADKQLLQRLAINPDN